jgi:hypothetical protein
LPVTLTASAVLALLIEGVAEIVSMFKIGPAIRGGANGQQEMNTRASPRVHFVAGWIIHADSFARQEMENA